jgi:hypothetical protein
MLLRIECNFILLVGLVKPILLLISVLDIKIYLCFDVNLLHISSLSLINVDSLII